MCGFTPTSPGLRPSDASIAPWGWRIELFNSSRRTPLCVLLILSQMLLAKLHTCDDVDVRWLSPPFGLRNATHRLPFTCRLLNGISRQRPCLHTSATSCSAPSPLPTRLGCLALPLTLWIAVWLVVRPAPPAALQRLMFPVSGHLNRRSFHDALLSQNDHDLSGAMIARFRGKPGLAWAVRDHSRREGYQAPSPLTGSHRLSGPCPHRFLSFLTARRPLFENGYE